jgi:hypothetical protein
LVSWQGHILSSSLDGTIRVWQPVENPAPGAVLDPKPAYSHPPEEDGGLGHKLGKVCSLGMRTWQRWVFLR